MNAPAPELLAQRRAAQRHAENEARLVACERPHVFALVRGSSGRGVKYEVWRCTLCEGVVRGLERRGYEAGMADAGRIAEAVQR